MQGVVDMGAWRVWYGRRATDPSVATVNGAGADRAMIESARAARRVVAGGLAACVALIGFVMIVDAVFAHRIERTAGLETLAGRVEVELHRTNDRLTRKIQGFARGEHTRWRQQPDWSGDALRARTRLSDQLRSAPGHVEGPRADATVRARLAELEGAGNAVLAMNDAALSRVVAGDSAGALALLHSPEARAARVALNRVAADYVRAVSHHVDDRLEALSGLRSTVLLMITPVGLLLLAAMFALGLRRAERGISDASFALASLASTCPLTGVPNRRAFDDVLAARCGRPEPFALVMLDLDGFKPVNDRYGHDVGDAVLQIVAERMRDFFGENRESGASVARLGGDEFAAFIRLDGDVPEKDRTRRALAVASDLRSFVTRRVELAGTALRLEASLGVACAPESLRAEGGKSAAEQLRHAGSMALRHAKARGGAIRLYDREMDVERQAEDARRAEVTRAQAADEFIPFVQPLVDLETSRPIGFEMLARWRRGDRVVGPGMFLDAIGRAGLNDKLTLGLLDRLLPSMARWARPLPVSVNLTSQQIEDEHFVAELCAVIERAGIEGSRMEVEILEGNLFSDTPAAVRGLAALRSMGASVALDDFGVGYSNFARLGEMPLDKIKIDRAFVMGMEGNETYRSVVRSVLDIARTLGVETVAEGIESERTALELRAMGCRLGKGFHFARPMPLADAEAMLRAEAGSAAPVRSIA